MSTRSRKTWGRKTRGSLSLFTHITIGMNSDKDMQTQQELALRKTTDKNSKLDYSTIKIRNYFNSFNTFFQLSMESETFFS